MEVLADLITDSGKGRIALDSGVKAIILKRREKGDLQSIPDVLEAEIRAFGGNSLVNLGRPEGRGYKELVIDVEKKLGGKPAQDDDIFALEDIVITRAIDKYAPEGAKALAVGGVALSDLLGQIIQGLMIASGTVAGVVAAAGTMGLVDVIGSRAATMNFPPLALGATGLAVFQAVGPAFRITIPAVLQVAKIRRTRFDADFSTYTEGLRACL
ncbi:hypothetical protein RHOFW104T7_05040 [Rhodanobacter thiooxydans]|uniref:Uncharacterized protein n=1 Tax=Rhodanobacter thiooxydans TaxID=416169 RepID=A0A154QMV7_9GAMM|nr:hypothetical protein RHOFW104T7_05040 [Rhodanobacter thiooxydans]